MGDADAGGKPTVSVLIATRGRPDMLAACLQSVLLSDHPSFEVIVVDQSAECWTSALLTDPRVVYIHQRARGKCRALNEAIPRARGQWLMFTDDDCTVPPDWIAKSARWAANGNSNRLVFAALTAIDHDQSLQFVPEFRPSRVQQLRGRRAATNRGGAGANLAAHRDVFARVGPFDEQLGPGTGLESNEEFDIFYRSLRAGVQVIYDPGNPVTHWGARDYADGSGQRLARGYRLGEGAVVAKHLKCGDLQALPVLADTIATELRLAISGLLRGHRPKGAKRLGYSLKGFALGLRQPLDRRSRLFRPRTAA
jgi:glycosyltransferase involved in cell wall biosynthesis